MADDETIASDNNYYKFALKWKGLLKNFRSMLIKKLGTIILLCLFSLNLQAQPADDVFGNTVTINTVLDSYVGKPSLLIILRDIDNGMNLPYLFDIRGRNNNWVAFTYGRNYTIVAAQLQIVKFKPKFNTSRKFVTNNFCNLQSNGRILRGESIILTVTGRLTPNAYTYNCNISTFGGNQFYISE